MANQSDISLGLKKESVYGTPVTVDRWLEVLPDPGLNYEYNTINGRGMRVGLSGIARSARRVRTTSQGAGDTEFELCTKGMGTLFELMMGTGASTLVSGTTYQQNFTFNSGLALSGTLQTGLVLADASGTRDQYTWNGATCSSFEINVPYNDIATVKPTWDVRGVDTTTSYATPSYATGVANYHWGIAAVTVGGTVTAPTTTAIATGGTAVTNVKSVSIKVDNNLSADRFAMGGAGLKRQPYVGNRAITGTIEVEHDSTTMRAAYMADTALPITLTMTSTSALSTGFATFQVVLSECKLDGPMPTSDGGQVPTVSYTFQGYDNETAAQTMWAVFRTADSAL